MHKDTHTHTCTQIIRLEVHTERITRYISLSLSPSSSHTHYHEHAPVKKLLIRNTVDHTNNTC